MAKNNVTVVYHVESEQPRMVVIDAENLSDPAWHPEGHAHIPIHPDVYNKMTHEDLHIHIHTMVAQAMATIKPQERE
jgi:hypothetical protein